MRAFAFVSAFVLCLAVAVARPAEAQLSTGNLSGVVTGADGAAAPGATVTLTGTQGAPWVQVTDAQGRFRFLGLPPGAFGLDATLPGRGTAIASNVRVSAGTDSSITLALKPVGGTAASPEAAAAPQPTITDGGRRTTVTPDDLEKIPTARDPWAILRVVPGVLPDRLGIGSSDNGQLVQVTGPGGPPDQTQWVIDGANVTDMAALGTSPAYYDFDSFEEMQVTTGGSDTTQLNGGVGINIVTKRGTNEWRGSGRYFVDSGSEPTEPLQTGLDGAVDFGASLGGPIVKDKLWFFGSYGRQNIDLQSRGLDAPFDRDVNRGTVSVNLNGKIGVNDRATFTFLQTDRLNSGVSQNPIRSSTTFNEESRPTAVKLEDTHIFSSNFYLTGMYSIVNGGFTAAPQNNLQPLVGDEEIERGSFRYDADRDSQELKFDAGSFFNTGPVGNQLKFGAGYRKANATDTAGWNGDILILPFGDETLFFRTPETTRATDTSYFSGYIQDTLTKENLTANLGLRFDSQRGSVGESFIRFPFSTTFPPLTFTTDEEIEWTSIVPRIGLAYALGAERKTLLRASYSRFPFTLKAQTANVLNPIEPLSPSGAEAYQFFDTNNNRAFDANEPRVFLGFPTFAPNDPRLLEVLNDVDKDLKTPAVDELLFGVEHALLPDFTIGANLSYRAFGSLLATVPIVQDGATKRPATASDYEIGEKLSGTFNLPAFGSGSYNTDVFTLKSNVTDTGGVLLTNSDRGQSYTGATITFNKRLANRWMLRGNFTFQDWTWQEAPDPSQRDADLTSPGEGGVVAPSVPITGRDAIYVNSGWSFEVNGLYQVATDKPWAFDLGGNVYSRQGFPAPLFRVFDGQQVPLFDLDKFRYDSPVIFDLRASKSFKFGESEVRFSVDAFNLFNERYVLQRDLNLDHAPAGRGLELSQPRVFRIGARLSFR